MCATQGAAAATLAQFGEVLAALTSSPEVDIAVPATLWPATPSPGLCHAIAAPASTVMFPLPGLDCLAPVFESSAAGDSSLATDIMKAAGLPAAHPPTALPKILAEGETCSVCADTVSMPPNCQDSTDHHLPMEGRPICQACRPLFDSVPFVPKTKVCLNPLCRRKWKQLTPKVLSSFCPPCMRHLEESLPAQQSGLEIASVECMYEHWHNIYAEIAEAVGYPAPGPKVVKAPETCESREQARKHWHNVLAAFEESFKSPPPSEEVRNWNSVYGRRKHYRGIIHRQNRRYCVAVEALEELSADLTPIRRVTTGMREFLLLDWQQQLHEGQEVNFVVCPNPSVDERDKVSRVVRLLGMPDKAEEKCASSLADLPASRSNSDIQTCSSGSSGSTTPPAFTDLMQWSQEALAEPEAPAAAKDNVPHALDCLPLGGNGALHQPPGINLHMSSSVHVLSAPPSRPRGNALFIPMGVRSSAMAAGLGSGHAQAGPGCSPLMDPRSPCAAYFGD
mmetsp:Transcript_68043/g.129461  ORF Transcript_68043/g.129461 Transcript_68043/m.129461 type:complete len:507 (-) Transcript_68043:245-1765(-)